MPAPADPLDAGLALAAAFDVHGISYALGGALAYGGWGIPRATLDVDVNVFLKDRELPRLARALASLGMVQFLSPEALCVFKVLFFRPKDLVDLERLVEVQGAALDAAYVRREPVALMGESDERVRRWDQLTPGVRGAE